MAEHWLLMDADELLASQVAEALRSLGTSAASGSWDEAVTDRSVAP